MLELVLVFYWCTKVYNAQPWAKGIYLEGWTVLARAVNTLITLGVCVHFGREGWWQVEETQKNYIHYSRTPPLGPSGSLVKLR